LLYCDHRPNPQQGSDVIEEVGLFDFLRNTNIPKQSKKCTIYSDASKNEFGCALMQENKAVGYASRQLEPYERNYLTYDLEQAIMVLH